MATSAEVIEAQRQRYFEYGIPLRDDGHVTKPEAFADTPLDAFGDPVNYLFPMVTQEQTEESQRAFVQDLASGLYPVGSDVIANRLQARLHNADESTNSTDVVIPTNDESSKDSSQVQSVESKRPLSNAAFEAGRSSHRLQRQQPGSQSWSQSIRWRSSCSRRRRLASFLLA